MDHAFATSDGPINVVYNLLSNGEESKGGKEQKNNNASLKEDPISYFIALDKIFGKFEDELRDVYDAFYPSEMSEEEQTKYNDYVLLLAQVFIHAAMSPTEENKETLRWILEDPEQDRPKGMFLVTRRSPSAERWEKGGIILEGVALVALAAVVAAAIVQAPVLLLIHGLIVSYVASIGAEKAYARATQSAPVKSQEEITLRPPKSMRRLYKDILTKEGAPKAILEATKKYEQSLKPGGSQ
jgi:hypothetical protein